MRLLVASLLALAAASFALPAQAWVPMIWLVTGDNNYLFDNLDLSSADIEMVKQSQASLLTDAAAQPGATATWSNAQSGNSGTVTYVQAFAYDGLGCRGLEHRVKQKGVSDPLTYRIAMCQTGDGWKML